MERSRQWVIPQDATEEERRAVQQAAREQFKLKMLAEINFDIQVCQLEGWDYREYILELQEELDRIIKQSNKKRGKKCASTWKFLIN